MAEEEVRMEIVGLDVRHLSPDDRLTLGVAMASAIQAYGLGRKETDPDNWPGTAMLDMAFAEDALRSARNHMLEYVTGARGGCNRSIQAIIALAGCGLAMLGRALEVGDAKVTRFTGSPPPPIPEELQGLIEAAGLETDEQVYTAVHTWLAKTDPDARRAAVEYLLEGQPKGDAPEPEQIVKPFWDLDDIERAESGARLRDFRRTYPDANPVFLVRAILDAADDRVADELFSLWAAEEEQRLDAELEGLEDEIDSVGAELDAELEDLDS